MKNTKCKMHILLLAVIALAAALSGCAGRKEAAPSGPEAGQSDLEYVQAKGTLVVGMTEFAPIAYREGDGWTGFDTDLVTAFAEEIGVAVEFVEINWDDKIALLENGSIDCLWNGMTLTEQLQNAISCTDPYLSNGQVAVFRTKDVGLYSTIESCNHVLFAVEAGSTGEFLLKELKYRYTAYDTQLEAMQSVSAKQADATVIDIVMATYYTGAEGEFSDLDFSLLLNDEKTCAGFRKDSDLTERANEFLKAAYADGTIKALASQYGIEDAIMDGND